jgi:hypothetical protein
MQAARHNPIFYRDARIVVLQPIFGSFNAEKAISGRLAPGINRPYEREPLTGWILRSPHDSNAARAERQRPFRHQADAALMRCGKDAAVSDFAWLSQAKAARLKCAGPSTASAIN